VNAPSQSSSSLAVSYVYCAFLCCHEATMKFFCFVRTETKCLKVLVEIVLYLAHVSPNGLKKFRQGHHDLDDDPKSESLSTTQNPAKL
jgi:hypothetical protein